MTTSADTFPRHQTSLFGTDLLLQLDPKEPLLALSQAIPWLDLERELGRHYCPGVGRPGLPIRLLVGLLLLKQLEDLSDEKVVLAFKQNPYYQAFCGLTEFSRDLPCDSSELTHFRKRIGKEGLERLFQMSVALQGKTALEDSVHIDTTVQEKHITYPTDGKLANAYGIQQRRTYAKEVKNLRLALRHFRHAKRRSKAKKALKRLRTIAHALIRELRRTLPKCDLFETHQKDFLFYERVLAQNPKDSDKIYSLHEPGVYCIAKGKDHKPYEYGNKVSIATTATGNIIVGVVSHETPVFDGHTLPEILGHVETSRGKPPKTAVCDRGYRGTRSVGHTRIILPATPLKRDSRYQRDQKRKRCRRRAAIEPIIGHLKSDFRMARNYLKGAAGDLANALLAATAWNLRLWLRAFLALIFARLAALLGLFRLLYNQLEKTPSIDDPACSSTL